MGWLRRRLLCCGGFSLLLLFLCPPLCFPFYCFCSRFTHLERTNTHTRHTISKLSRHWHTLSALLSLSHQTVACCAFSTGAAGENSTRSSTQTHSHTQCGHFPLELEHTHKHSHLHTHTIDGYSNGTKRTIRWFTLSTEKGTQCGRRRRSLLPRDAK